MIEHPEPAEGVLHEVSDDPVWSEELGDGWDVLGRYSTLALLKFLRGSGFHGLYPVIQICLTPNEGQGALHLRCEYR